MTPTSKPAVTPEMVEKARQAYLQRYGLDEVHPRDSVGSMAAIKFAADYAASAVQDAVSECICKGNWRLLVEETESLMGQRFRDENGEEYTFIGLMHGADDYYYCMYSVKGKLVRLSCVGSIEGYGFTPVAALREKYGVKP